jgi:hypothetical protein
MPTAADISRAEKLPVRSRSAIWRRTVSRLEAGTAGGFGFIILSLPALGLWLLGKSKFRIDFLIKLD